mgnify:CR=1 FL=1
MDRFIVLSLADVSQSWAQVLRAGHFVHSAYGEFDVTPDDLASMVANFQSGVRPKAPTRLVVDYDHGELTGRAAGWVTDLEVRAGGTELWAQVEWTDEAAEAIRRREYQFTSAEFAWAYQDKGDGTDRGPTLLAMAITNRPFVEGMQPLALSEKVSQALLASDAAKPRAAAPVADTGVKSRKENTMEEQIRTLLKLDENADVLAAVKALRDNRTIVLEERDTVTARLTEVSAERDDLKRQLGEASRDALLAKYEQEGKLTPAMREAWAAEMALNEPERFATLMDTLPVVVDLTERGSDNGADSGDTKLTEAEISLGKQLGISEADLLKAKGR